MNAPNEYRKIDTALEPEESWYHVPPIPGHVIMNLSNALHNLSNGLLNSGKHRVVTPPGDRGKHERIRVLLVARPEESTPMETLKSSKITRTGSHLDDEWTAGEWGAEKVTRFLTLMDTARG